MRFCPSLWKKKTAGIIEVKKDQNTHERKDSLSAENDKNWSGYVKEAFFTEKLINKSC